jgi:hypothetical protein
MAEPDKIKHLEFIQFVISRMNSNSFQSKSWAVAIVSALLAIYASEANIGFIIIAYLPLTILWLLDAYYLHQERKYRGLFDAVRLPDSAIGAFDLNASSFREGFGEYVQVVISRTIFPLYFSIEIVFLVLICIH